MAQNARMPDAMSREEPEGLFPARRHPYYIYTPAYSRLSAGVKALHLLCHELNRRGETAYIFILPQGRSLRPKPVAHPDLLTPELTNAIVARHHRQRRTPIVVYPEITKGNPHNAPVVVRYVMNYPGLLGGDSAYPASELCYGYSENLALAAGAPKDQVLFLPTVDTSIYRPEPAVPRSGSCFYAARYRLEGHDPHEVPAGSVEIHRDGPLAQEPEQIAELFRRSEVFYTYHNTALAMEAALCGCPTVYVPNPLLKEVIVASELGWDGAAWGFDAAELARARDTVDRARTNFLQSYALFREQLGRFVTRSQELAAKAPYPEPMRLPRRWHRALSALLD